MDELQKRWNDLGRLLTRERVVQRQQDHRQQELRQEKHHTDACSGSRKGCLSLLQINSGLSMNEFNHSFLEKVQILLLSLMGFVGQFVWTIFLNHNSLGLHIIIMIFC